MNTWTDKRSPEKVKADEAAKRQPHVDWLTELDRRCGQEESFNGEFVSVRCADLRMAIKMLLLHELTSSRVDQV